MIPKNLILVKQTYRFGDRNYFMGHSRVVLVWFSGHAGLFPLYKDKLNDCYLWNKNAILVIKRRVSGKNHFQFLMLLLTECFFPRKKQMH